MSKPIKFNCIIGSIRTRKDNSLGLSIETPEMNNEETLVMLRLKGINLDCAMTPLNVGLDAPVEVKAEISRKSQSERIRGTLFCLWSHLCDSSQLKDVSFETFYQQETDKYIDGLKELLPKQPF